MHQPSVLLVSYHFYPSHEVGAKRPTALAQFLAGKGLRVAVVSAFGGDDIAPGSQVLPGIVAVPVPRPPRRLIELAIRVKRRIRGAQAIAAQGGKQDPSTTEGQPGSPRSPWKRVRDLFFRPANVIDDYKAWGRHAWSARRSSSVALRAEIRRPPGRS